MTISKNTLLSLALLTGSAIYPHVSVAQHLYGTPGDDTLFATSSTVAIFGLQGDDFIATINGISTGPLYLHGGSGIDVIQAYNGQNNIFIGGSGDDFIYGGSGNDSMWGGFGIDKLKGHDGDDLIVGGYGNDTIEGGYGSDILYGHYGNDYLYGEQGVDTIYGGTGNDWIDAGGGFSDEMYGESGDDTLNGNGGDGIFSPAYIADGGDGSDACGRALVYISCERGLP